MFTLLENTKWTNVKAAESTATTGSTTDAVDMAGYDSVVFVRKAGAARTFTIEASDTGVTAVYSEAYAIRTAPRNLPISNASAATDGFTVDAHVTPTT
jgi:hypothetical protein